ncbi:hypothetical protein TJA_07620 [Thermus sp. LT1-2-5]|uniref:N-6 DNA methylase n=1 Tax=Thermus sp. LT1-2-5 TaxID=3026935 RepID=UPI0030E99928
MPRRNAPEDPLSRWLSTEFTGPERSYNPLVRDFLAHLLGYPEDRVITEDPQGRGLADVVLYTPEGDPWVVGEFKKDDGYLQDSSRTQALWQEKRKYITGFTRYVLFLTPKHLQLRDPTGKVLLRLDLTRETTESLRERLALISYGRANHEHLWTTYTRGELPYAYLELDEANTRKLKEDLLASFNELTKATERALERLQREYEDHQKRIEALKKNLGSIGKEETLRRALMRLEKEFPERLKALFQVYLPRFADQYAREVEGNEAPTNPVIREAFAADSAAALMARVLFLRFLEDLNLTKRRLTNGGPERWQEFVEFLSQRATALLKVASLDLSHAYREPFEDEMFAWVLETNGELDRALQRLLLRVNAYNFSTLSEEILGDIYQSFLPPPKRKRLGEFYTPKEVVDYILRETALAHPGGNPRVLDPACGSGSFLVRYLHHRLKDAQERGVDLEPKELSDTIWGFDLNPFAAYITLFQLLWGFLRLKRERPQIHVYNLNSLLDDNEVAQIIGQEHLSPGERERDTGEWDYVVGNPPYIRAERAKYGEAIRDLYKEVWGQNGDTGLLFLWRALKGSGTTDKPWVKPGGKLGMVVSGGYASSEAAAPVWSLLWPGKGYTLRKLVWLEFVGKVWDANVIPMILIVERRPNRENDTVEIWVPSSWPKTSPDPGEVAHIPYRDFFDPKVNPVARPQTGINGYGEYLLPLLKEGDPELLRKLFPGGEKCTTLTTAMETQWTRHRKPQPFWWTYGIQRGGVETTEAPTGKEPVAVIAGRGLAVAWAGEPLGYVDLDQVRRRPYGKLSLWGNTEWPRNYLAVANISLVPIAALIRSGEESPVATLDSTIIGIPKKNLAEAVAAYLNSSLARWYYLVRLRSGVLEGSSRAHIYPRTLEALPWPKDPDLEVLRRLKDLYQKLEELALASRSNPKTWLQGAIEERIQKGRAFSLSAPKFGLNFHDWQEACKAGDITLEGTWLKGGLFSQLDLKDPDLARFVHLVLSMVDEEAQVKKRDLQKLQVPEDYRELLLEYERREHAFSSVPQAFLRILEEIDEAVFDLFGLTKEEREHIRKRLRQFPLNRLKPRYPWEVVRLRPLKAYTEDRYR